MATSHTFLATVDRIEDDIAVLLLDGDPFDLPLSLLPPVREGVTLRFTIAVDPAATAELTQQVTELVAELGAEDDGGDIEL